MAIQRPLSPDTCKVSFSVNCSARGGVRLPTQLVVDGVHNPLPGAKVSFRGLYGAVPKQELNLLNLSTD